MRKFSNSIKTHIKQYPLLLVTLILFIFGCEIQPFDDEYEVLLGGQYLLEQVSIYGEYFSHHQPLPYYTAAVLEFLSLGHVYIIRILWSLILWTVLFLNFKIIVSWLGLKSARTYLLVQCMLIFLPHSYFFSLQSDSISAHFLVFAIIHLAALMEGQMYKFIHLRIFLGLMVVLHSSLALIPLAFAVFVIWIAHNMVNKTKVQVKQIVKIILVFAMFDLYLLWNNWHEYIEQVFIFNRKYYSAFNYEMPNHLTRFVSHRIQRLHNTLIDFHQHIYKPSHWLFVLRIIVCVGTIALMYFKNRWIAILFGISLIGMSIRSGLYSNFDDNWGFHQLALIDLSMLLIVYLVHLHKKGLLLNFIRVNAGLYLIITASIALIGGLKYVKNLTVYKGQETVLDTKTELDLYFDSIGSSNSVWILPFEVRQQYLLNSVNNMKYQYLLPWIISCDPCINEVRKRLDISPPDYIVWNAKRDIWGMKSNKFGADFLTMLAANYIQGTMVSSFQIYKRIIPLDEQAPLIPHPQHLKHPNFLPARNTE